MAGFQARTKRGYDLAEVVSVVQKAIRRNEPDVAGYFAIEMFESHYTRYLWRRLVTISAEDCAGVITTEVMELARAWEAADKARSGSGRVFVAKAVLLLAQAPKSRDADHLTNLVYDRELGDVGKFLDRLAEVRGSPDLPEIPEYAYDVHTRKGRAKGKTKRDFFLQEFAALNPRQPGLFDALPQELPVGDDSPARRGAQSRHV